MSERDRRLEGIGRELWPDPAEAYGRLAATQARRRRQVLGRAGLAVAAAACVAAAALVVPGLERPASRGIAVAGGPAGGPASAAVSAAGASATATPAPSPLASSPAPALAAGAAAPQHVAPTIAWPPVGATVAATDRHGAAPAFVPATVTITAGQSVTFVNTGSSVHTATASNGAWSSGDLRPGQSYTTPALGVPGSFGYFSSYQQALGMVGTIVVLPAAAPSSPLPAPAGAVPAAGTGAASPPAATPGGLPTRVGPGGVVPSPGMKP
jgi:plastocyanin